MASRRFNQDEVFSVYKKAFSIQIDWAMILDEDFVDWLNIFEKANNCSKDLVVPALLAMTSSICGPKTRITVQGSSFSSPLNSFIFVVSDPGGGKSQAFTKVVQPVLDMYSEKNNGLHLNLENYTTAGVHHHQTQNKGYGVITSDEGKRFASSISLKQSKGESERSLLCKMWTGQGDYVALSNGSRGFDKTSMSMFLPIQPSPFMSEMINFTSEADGLLDRFLIITARPVMYPSAVNREFFEQFRNQNLQNFVPMFDMMFEEHKKGQVYILDENAQHEYDRIVDEYAEYITRKYSFEEDDTDHTDIPPTQSMSDTSSSSKDTIHILRLAGILHILNSYFQRARRPVQDVQEAVMTIGVHTVRRARYLFNIVSQQKSIYTEAVHNSVLQFQDCTKIAKVPKTLREKIMRCLVKQKGREIPLRTVQRHIKGSLMDNIVCEIEILERDLDGLLKQQRHSVLKPAPENFVGNEKLTAMLKAGNMGLDEYTTNYNAL